MENSYVYKNEKIKKNVECLAWRLSRSVGFSDSNIPDIKQDLWVHLIDRMPQFDASKSSLETFANRILRNKISDIRRFNRAQLRDSAMEYISLNDDGNPQSQSLCEDADIMSQDAFDAVTGRTSETRFERFQREYDVDRVLSKLDPKLKEIAGLLTQMSVAEIARTLGMSRSTLYGNYIKRLEKIFEAEGLRIYV